MNKTGLAIFATLTAAAILSAQATPPGGPVRGPFGVVGGVPGGGAGGSIVVGPKPDMLIPGAPFSGVQVREVRQSLPNGNQIQRLEDTKFYRDGQGRMRIEVPQPNPTNDRAPVLIEIFDPVAGAAYILDPSNLTGRKSAFLLPKTQGRSTRKRQAGQVQEEDLGIRKVNGFEATGRRATQTIPAGAIGNRQTILSVTETWTSTVLKIPILHKRSDPRFGDSTVQLTQIALGEPDPSLFQVPENYKLTPGGPFGPGIVGGVKAATKSPARERSKD
ncbi:MAG TPA: hypothetical protein VLE22_13865 [Bryobacteraceae bacterium]|nr:hypothetical protein [Bryobacteraceae bacterium]